MIETSRYHRCGDASTAPATAKALHVFTTVVRLMLGPAASADT
jgi:hypothetical protein